MRNAILILSGIMLLTITSAIGGAFPTCGIYEFNAFVHCENKICEVILAKGSLSEEKIEITSNQFYYRELNNKYADLKIKIHSTNPLKAKTVLPPQLAIASDLLFAKQVEENKCL